MTGNPGRVLQVLVTWLVILAVGGPATAQRHMARPRPGPRPRPLVRLHGPSALGAFTLFQLRLNRPLPAPGVGPGTEPASPTFRAGFIATSPNPMNALTHGLVGSAGAFSNVPDSSAANAQSADHAQDVAAVLSANGLPSRAGSLRWPVGLLGLPGIDAAGSRLDVGRALSMAAVGEQRDEFGATVQGKAVPAIRELRHALEEQKRELTPQQYEEAAQFLRKLSKAVRDLE
jgi:hypothetical protein